MAHLQSLIIHRHRHELQVDDNHINYRSQDDHAIKAVHAVAPVAVRAVDAQLEQHLQNKIAGETQVEEAQPLLERPIYLVMVDPA